MDLPLAFAFTAGMLATVNPCGFAMLPAYLGYFVGIDEDTGDGFAAVVRALVVSATVAAGFVLVFGVLAFLIAEFSLLINEHLPWVTMLLGAVLVGVGVAMLRGYEPTVRLPKLQKGGTSRELASMFLFGMSYATASLSCTIPIFSATVSVTLTRSSAAGVIVVLLTYAAGMAAVLGALTVTLSLARRSLAQGLRRSMPYVQRVSGGLLVVAGAFLVYYGWYERQVYNNDLSPPGPGGWALRVQSWFTGQIDSLGATRIGAALVIVLTLAALGTYAVRQRRAPHS